MASDAMLRVRNAIQWFAQIGQTQLRETWVGTDPRQLRADPIYGLKCFLLYANQRENCPRGYAVAGIKAVEVCRRDNRPLTELALIFEDLYHGKKNRRLMPVLDPKISNLDVPDIVAQVEAGHLSTAFDAINVRGAAHKIKSFFLRDIAIATSADSRSWTPSDQYIYCQPVDTWVQTAVECLAKLIPEEPRISPPRRYLGLSRANKKLATLLIQLSLEAGVSPLHVNHGVWYFARHAVEDKGQLQRLLERCDLETLQQELSLMSGFADLF